MKLLAKLIVSLERLVRDPGEWFEKTSGLVKLLLIVAILPIVSTVTIIVYQTKMQTSPDAVMTAQRETYQELLAIKQEIKELQESQTELAGEDKKILGASESAATIKQRISDYNSSPSAQVTDTNPQLLFIPKGNQNEVKVYALPNENSQVKTTIATNTWYLFEKKEGDWYLITINEQSEEQGWIPAKLVQDFK